MNDIACLLLCYVSPEVEHLTYDPKIEGFNPATDTMRGKTA